jgi:hypothetical protein
VSVSCWLGWKVKAILAALAKRVAAIEITGSVKRLYNNTLRGLDSLPLTLTPAT